MLSMKYNQLYQDFVRPNWEIMSLGALDACNIRKFYYNIRILRKI
jgi:hypothetical protein